jgi:hypothetical protein
MTRFQNPLETLKKFSPSILTDYYHHGLLSVLSFAEALLRGHYYMPILSSPGSTGKVLYGGERRLKVGS